ncbi:hypothetical protein C8039_09225 [Halogeometricum sp. wsp3]|nr:hypothetical protein C8039_09225 [Halogeometricum sp. wsp3]
MALAMPWFLWESGTWAGLPVWLWWHVGWMVLAGVVLLFYAHDWGLGVEEVN